MDDMMIRWYISYIWCIICIECGWDIYMMYDIICMEYGWDGWDGWDMIYDMMYRLDRIGYCII